MSLLGGHFDDIPDPRRAHTRRHTLADIFALTLCAVTSGADTFVAVEAFGHAQIDWLRRHFPFDNGVPSHDTLSRVFALLDRAHFEHAFAAWAASAFKKTAGQVVAVDGKRLRRAHHADESMMTIVSAWATESRVALGQVATERGEGEIPAISRLLTLLDLSGCIVTIDAAGCQTDIVTALVDQKADYVLVVKGNQGYLRDDCERWIEDAITDGTADTFETAERGHGRDEHRLYWSVAVPEGEFRPRLWAGLASVGMVESRRTVAGTTSVEHRYFATSLPANAETLARAVRGHWGIENGLHWVLDVAFREDESRLREAHAAANLSVVRRMSTTLIRAEPTSKGGVQTCRMRAAWDGAYRERTLGLE